MRIGILIGALLLSACGMQANPTVVNRDSEMQKQIDELNTKVKSLSLIADAFTSGIPNVYGDCSTLSAGTEKTICQIANTASAMADLQAKTQLSQMGKQFQNALFGEDCTDDVSAGCPVAGSIKAQIAATQTTLASHTASIASMQSSITTINTSLSTLSSKVDALKTRLDSFNGTADSIEVIITGINSDIATLKTQVATITAAVDVSKLLTPLSLCGDNSSSGPLFETILMSGDHVKLYGYIKTGTADGLGLFFTAGDANKYMATSLNTKRCYFKVYNNAANTKVQVCWIKTDRSATEAQIDAARTAATAICTAF